MQKKKTFAKRMLFQELFKSFTIELIYDTRYIIFFPDYIMQNSTRGVLFGPIQGYFENN